MKKEKELPMIDLPEEWLVGTDVSREILNMYANYPVRLKCEVFALCRGGEIEASVNLNRFVVRANSFAVLTPGSIFQIHRVEGNLRIYFFGFSAHCIDERGDHDLLLSMASNTQLSPILNLPPEGAGMVEKYFDLLISAYEYFSEDVRKQMTSDIYQNIHTGLKLYYEQHNPSTMSMKKNEQLWKEFSFLVLKNYRLTRNVAWYAEQLGISQAHLCNSIKQMSGRTCTDIISTLVIMDAKSQLKQTRQSIQAISDYLNFSDISFFGKYFKRYVGMSPLDYRNS
ncbi:MAG: helix-turn-helix domain-containing protein [Bacteroidales bacterium]|nr:helix-turn-helix domain-containing protein [Bacteroidales bacterium]